MRKKKGWHANWDPTFDLSRGGKELDFRNRIDMNSLLVETNAVSHINQIIKNIKSENISSRYHIIGDRGMGKSTILNYITHSLFIISKKEKILPVYCVLEKTSDNNNLEEIFFRSLLKHMFRIPDNYTTIYSEEIYVDEMNQLMKAEKEYYEILKEKGEVKFDFVYSAFENQLRHMCKTYEKIVFLIDGLDKQPTESVLKFIRDAQENLNYLIAKYNCIIIDSADPTWRETLDTKEFSGVRGSTIHIRPWTPMEVHSLITKRLERIGIYKMPFSQDALDVIVEDYNGNSRLILQYASNLLDYAYREKIQTIGRGIARDIIWKEDSKRLFSEKIINDKQIRYAYLKLEDFISDRQSLNILIATYNQRKKRLSRNLDYDTRTTFGITLNDNVYHNTINRLENRGCIRSSKVSGFFELESDILSIFEYTEKLGENVVALPVILQELQSKIVDEVIEENDDIFLKEQVRQVFTKNYSRWMNYSDIKKNMLYNPRTKRQIESAYGPDYDKVLDNQIPLLVGQFRSQGNVMIDEEIKKYKWRPSHLEYEVISSFHKKDIIDILDKMYLELKNNKYNNLHNFTRSLFDFSKTEILKLLNKENDKYNNKDFIKLLNYIGVDTKSYSPINNYISMMNKKASSVEEANLLTYTNMLYLKRLYRKIIQLETINKKNVELKDKVNKLLIDQSFKQERSLFKIAFSKILLSKFGEITSLMSELKLGNGYVIEKPKVIKELNEDVLLKGKLYKCEYCNDKHIIKAEKIECVLCNTHKKECKYESDVYFLNPVYYQSWNVWMEEYSKLIFNKLPIFYYESGLILNTPNKANIKKQNEIDGLVIYNGNIIAIEYKDILDINDESNPIIKINDKFKTMDFIDSVLVIYKKVSNENKLIHELNKYQPFIRAMQIKSPYKYEQDIHTTLNQLTN